ncbi:MAG TPA: hypothetical protein VKH37_10315, partial [Ferruginibacter sp.]|nr:hypothetical protein [Ferruginibacter sp.]
NEQKDFLNNYHSQFLNYHNASRRFFANPELNFSEASLPNKDGSELIIKSLTPVSSNNISVPIYINYLNDAVSEAEEQLQKHYHSDQADEQIRKSAREGSDLQLKMDIVFGMDAYYFGNFIEHLTITESEILKFYHDLLQSEKLVKKKNTNAYILLRLQNPGIKPDLSYAENVEVLRVNYHKETAEETEEYFRDEKIDLNELFFGDMYNLLDNSIILAEEAKQYWYNNKLTVDNFEFFTDKGFEKSLLTGLFDTLKTSFDKHQMTRRIAEEIRGYVDVQKRIEKAEDMIAHISAGIINEYVTTFGWKYYSDAEKNKMYETNSANKLNLKFPAEQESFQTIQKVAEGDTNEMTLEKLVEYMDNLNENLSKNPVDKDIIKYVPMVKNYQKWSEMMKIAFIANCDIPTYNIEANKVLHDLQNKMKEFKFSIS